MNCCFEGSFWFKGKNQNDIESGEFDFVGQKITCNSDGSIKNCKLLTHEQLLRNPRCSKSVKSINYYPRGKVRICNGYVYITIPPRMNVPKVTKRITQMYNLDGLISVYNVEMDYRGKWA